MRKLEYLSNTSISAFNKNLEEFYLTYLSEVRAPRFPQTRPMSIGSAFDAYVKSFLHEKLIGKDPKFELQTLFEAQVEPHNRDWAWEHGKYAFECYKEFGALNDILIDLQQSITSPRFEFEVRGKVSADLGVVLLGRPDVAYVNRENCHVTLDFKVNGYCGNYNTSPKPGYIRIRAKDGKGGPHKDCVVSTHKGTMINIASYLETVDQDWAQQLTIYAILCGAELGSDFVVAIDQFACKPSTADYPTIRIAQHRLRIGKTFQEKVIQRAQEIWEIVQSDHIFRDVSREESIERCHMLDRRAEALKNPKLADDVLFNTMTRGNRAEY